MATFLTSCSGYVFRDMDNPFADQGIRSIAVPMFVNRTSQARFSSELTRQAIDALSSFKGLRVENGSFENEDAVVIGIIKPATKGREIFYSSKVLMSEEQQEAIGKRNSFLVPTTAKYDFKLELIILKRPTKDEIKFYTEYFKFSKVSYPRTILRKEFAISDSFAVENPVGGIDSNAPIRGALNKGSLRKSIEKTASNFAVELKEVLANAF